MREFSWYSLTKEECLQRLGVEEEKGLKAGEAAARLEIWGYNRLQQKRVISPGKIFLSQFTDFMVLVLIGATLISGLLGEFADALTILAIVVINAVLGFIQEYRAEKSIEALKKMTAPEATVFREGIAQRIPAEEVVPGDILLLNMGDKVAADARLLSVHNLEMEEAALTGESQPVAKRAETLEKKEIPLGDRFNMVYMGTSVTKGRGKALVVATGMETEMGRIAGLMEAVDQEETPLQKRLHQLGKWLVFSCLLICALVVATGIFRGEPVYQMFLAGVSLAVAAIPEGLPAIVTVALAVGVQKMVKRQSIIRRLPAVETLGCATVICSDKTGTLTCNEMTARQIYCAGSLFQVTGEGYEPKGELMRDNKKVPWPKEGTMSRLLQALAFCNNAFLKRNGQDIGGLFRAKKNASWEIEGDPTDGALLVLAGKANYWRELLERTQPRLLEIPFDSQRKLMTVVVGGEGYPYAFVKGAPEVLFPLCSRVDVNGRLAPLTEDLTKILEQENEKMGAQALRVLGVAFRQLPLGLSPDELKEEAEKELIFLGLVGMIDPPRPAAVKAIRVCREAGIKPVMITGDHQITARAIAEEMGFPLSENSILTGSQLDTLTDDQLAARVEQVSVYARVSPQHKLRIIKALKEQGHVVAMTGDGVNDAPALKEADIGVAMGKGGTEVTKEASDMILADDNFATIIAAVEEGRSIYENIRKFIRYLLSCNVGEVLTMFLASLVGLPLPLLPMQILWVNLVTDGLPAMALGVDNADPDLMERRPRAPGESIFAHGLAKKIISRGVQIGLGTLLVFSLAYYLSDGDLTLSRTMAFTTLVFSQLFHVFECKSECHSLFKIGIFSNPYLVMAVSISTLMQLSAIYLPFLQSLFKTVPLNGFHWGIILAVAGGRTMINAFSYYIMSPLQRRVVYLRH